MDILDGRRKKGAKRTVENVNFTNLFQRFAVKIVGGKGKKRGGGASWNVVGKKREKKKEEKKKKKRNEKKNQKEKKREERIKGKGGPPSAEALRAAGREWSQKKIVSEWGEGGVIRGRFLPPSPRTFLTEDLFTPSYRQRRKTPAISGVPTPQKRNFQ